MGIPVERFPDKEPDLEIGFLEAIYTLNKVLEFEIHEVVRRIFGNALNDINNEEKLILQMGITRLATVLKKKGWITTRMTEGNEQLFTKITNNGIIHYISNK